MYWDLVGLILGIVPLLLFGYAYFGYPAILRLWSAMRPTIPAALGADGEQPEWPEITITIPAYNEADSIGATIERVLALDYPPDRRHILVVSDASTDRTDEVVRSYSGKGVELLRLPERGGKTAAENAAARRLRGELVVNADATIVIERRALKDLVAAFSDPSVGVASGRDVSIGGSGDDQNAGESQYVGYEMWIRQLETAVGSIVGASGCFYATRAELQDRDFPGSLSRDFASALIAREHGYRSVSVTTAVCRVPRTTALGSEYRRKIRTMARGLRTLWFKRALLNPVRYGRFAFMLASHKLARWMVPLTAPLVLVGLALLAPRHPVAAILLGLGLGSVVFGIVTLKSGGPLLGRLGTMIAYGVTSLVAGLIAWLRAFSGRSNEVWEPTRRPRAAAQTRGLGGK